MKLSKKAVIGAALTALLSGVMAMPASAAPAGPATAAAQATAAPSLQPEAAEWNFSGYYADLATCRVASEVIRQRGYPTDPPSGCYRARLGYYFYYWA
jgi:hypothetical protein